MADQVTTLEGIDVANWQGEIDWPAVAGVAFAWCKATEGYTFNDPFFAANVAGARAAGIPVGGYHFARFDQASADLQAQHFRAVCGRLDLPAMLDAESHWLADPAANTDWILRWFDSTNETHRVLYTNGDGVDHHVDSARLVAAGVDLFYAHPGATTFAGRGAWPTAAVVQYGARAVPGIAGGVDADRMLDSTLARYLGDDAMPPAHLVLLDDGEIVAFPSCGAAPYRVANPTTLAIGQITGTLATPTPDTPSSADESAAIRAAVADAHPPGSGLEHFTGTVELTETP